MRVKFGSKYECPVCGKHMFDADSGEKCPICGWTEDPVQAVNPTWTGDNNISLEKARTRYEKYGTISAVKIREMKNNIK